jgi:hypothetical protein
LEISSPFLLSVATVSPGRFVVEGVAAGVTTHEDEDGD